MQIQLKSMPCEIYGIILSGVVLLKSCDPYKLHIHQNRMPHALVDLSRIVPKPLLIVAEMGVPGAVLYGIIIGPIHPVSKCSGQVLPKGSIHHIVYGLPRCTVCSFKD